MTSHVIDQTVHTALWCHTLLGTADSVLTSAAAPLYVMLNVAWGKFDTKREEGEEG